MFLSVLSKLLASKQASSRLQFCQETVTIDAALDALKLDGQCAEAGWPIHLEAEGIAEEAAEAVDDDDLERVIVGDEQFPRLKERSAQIASTLSGGEQQMLAIGRCLMSRPELVLLDEPTLGLAPVMVKEVFAIIERLRRAGVTILLAEQNVRQTLEIADQAYVIENGRLVLFGVGAALATDATVRKAYLGL